MVDITGADEGHPLQKDDISSPSNRNGKGIFQLAKFGLADANANAPAGTVISNIYEPEDEYQNLYIGASRDQGIIQPPYYQRTLDRLSQENNTLSPCIEAMVTNIDGTGYTFENADKGEDEAEDASDDPQLKALEDFFQEPWPGISFRTMRKLLRRDIKRTGNGYLEVLRNPQDRIVMVRHVDAKMMRMVRLDDPIPVVKSIMRNGTLQKISVMTRERRFCQNVNGISLVFFKEFGASRDLNKNTGLWIAVGSRLPAIDRGTEIIHFVDVPDAHTPYGVPTWVSQLPSILGSRRAEEFNLEFFEHGGIPPVLILLQGGALGAETRKALEMKTSGPAKAVNRVQVIEVEPNGGSWDQQALTRVTVERFGSERTADSMFEKYDERCTIRVLRAFRLPPIFIGAAQDYTFASAFASYTVAEAQVFKPEREEFDEVMSMLLIPAMGFDGYAMRSNALAIEDATLKLQGIQIAISTNVVNDTELLTELNEATGTNMKADPALVTLKSNQALGLNPDGSKPAPAPMIQPVQGVPTTALDPNPSVQHDEGNPKSPTGPTGFTKPGKAISKPQPSQAGGQAGAKPPSGQGAGGKAATPGNGKKVGKVKKSESELVALAMRSLDAMAKNDHGAMTGLLAEIRSFEPEERAELRMYVQELHGLQSPHAPGVIKTDHVAALKVATGILKGQPHDHDDALAERLIKGRPDERHRVHAEMRSTASLPYDNQGVSVGEAIISDTSTPAVPQDPTRPAVKPSFKKFADAMGGK